MANVEYICTQCWHSFEEDAESVDPVICPSCGAEQPQGNQGSTEVEPEHVAPEEETPEAKPEKTVEESTDEPADSTDDEEAETSDEEGSDDPLAGLDASKCGWRVRSGGLTYNFHGVTALQNWCSGKKGLEGMEVSIEDTGVWRNLQEFRRLLRNQEAIEAFRGMDEEANAAPADAPSEPKAKKPMEPKPKETPKASSSKPADAKPKANRDSSARVSKPSVRSTGEFTFKVGDGAVVAGPNWAAMGGGFVVGLLFGLALWYLGVLSILDIEPLALF